MTPTPLTVRTGWPLYAGMAVAGAAAVVASASTLAALARTAGWAGWTPWLLPASVDVGGSVGGWVWLRPGAPQRARRFGRVVAFSGAAASLVGNGAGHLITTGYLHPGPVLVVVVGAVPAAVLVALAHLSALLAHHDTPEPAPADDTDNASQQHVPALEPPPLTAEPVAGDDAVDTRAAVLAAIEAEPVTVADLVKATGRSRTTIVGHLTALTSDGAVARGHDKRYRPLAHPHALRLTTPGSTGSESAEVEEPAS